MICADTHAYLFSGLITCSVFIIIIPSSHIDSTKYIKSSESDQLLC